MALSKIDVANMLTGVTPVANGGTARTVMTGTPIQVVKTKSQQNRMRYNGNEYQQVPYTSTRTSITLKNSQE